MLKEDRKIDQLFCNGLTNYQSTPPLFVWNHVQSEMDGQKRILLLNRLKMSGIVAAVIIAFMAGSWFTNFTNTKNYQSNDQLSREESQLDYTTTRSSQELSTSTISEEKGKNSVTNSEHLTSAPLLTSLASFGANTYFLDLANRPKADQSQEINLSDTEKKFIDHLKQNLKQVEKLTHWIEALVADTPYAQETSPEHVFTSTAKQNISIKKGPESIYPPTPSNRRWSLKAAIAPSIYSHSSNGTRENNLLALSPQEPNFKSNTTEMSLSGELMAGYKINKRLTIKGGFGFSKIRNITHRVNINSTLSQDVISPVTTVTIPTGIIVLTQSITGGANQSITADDQTYSPEKIKHNLTYIDLPLMASYKIIKGKVDLSVSGGITTHILVGNKVFVPDEQVITQSAGVNNIRNVVYSNAIGLLMEYELSNRLTLSVEPRIKHFMNSLNNEQSINYKPYKTEMVTGLTYSFN